MRRIVVVVMICGCGDDEVPTERACSAEMFDSIGGVYPTKRTGECFPDVGDDSRVGVCEGLAGHDPSVVFVWGRVFGACPGCDGAFGPSDCRPLVCERDAECPRFATRESDSDEIIPRTYECRSGVCQDADRETHARDEIGYDDAQMLCLADVGPGEHYEGEPWCPGTTLPGTEPCPLPLPDGCMQP